MAASVSDRLADTIDYADIHRRIAAIVQQQSFDLLERLAAAIVDAVLEDARVRSVEIPRQRNTNRSC